MDSRMRARQVGRGFGRLPSRFGTLLYATLAVMWAIPLAGQAQQPAHEALNYVDPFTGDFRYSLPLMTVTGPNGESFPLVLSYRAGITVEQEASWVGLGWNLNTGEIRRDVNGVPDDWRQRVVDAERYDWTTNSYVDVKPAARYYGPVHFDAITFPANETTVFNSVFDTYRTDYGQSKVPLPFEFPDYDYYTAVGPGFSGKLNLSMLQSGSLLRKNSEDYKYNPHLVPVPCTPIPCLQFDDDPIFDEANSFTIKPQFWYAGDHYVNAHLTPFWGSGPSLGVSTSGDFSSTVNQAPEGGYHIEYFTNNQINNFEPDPQVAPVNPLRDSHKLLDYRVTGSPRRSSPEFDGQGIGAIHVTDPNGMTYHYSLPVYTLYEANYKFEVDAYDEDNIIDSASDIHNDSVNREQRWKYAHTWKLTAITGPDYVDENHNGIADYGDSGYWISLVYTKWASAGDDVHISRYPYFGYHMDYRKEEVTMEIAGETFKRERFYPEGSMRVAHREMYYLDRVETASQVAFFVKEYRRDGADTRPGKMGKLRLNRLVLMDRLDAGVFNTTSLITIPLPFTRPTSNAARQTCNEQQYDAAKTAIEEKALQTVVFDFDYSLAPKTYDNVNNNYGRTALQLSGITQFIKMTANSTVTTNTGKLTLKKVHMYGKSYEKVSPPYEFSYDENPNPEYDHVRQDMFGYYKGTNSDKMDNTKVQRGVYTTPANKDALDAWSLSRIKTPTGKLIIPEYEADEYEHVMAESGGNYEDPVRIFRIDKIFGSATNNVNQPTVYLENDDLLDILTNQAGDVVSKTAFFDYICSGAGSTWDIDNTISSVAYSSTNTYDLNLTSTDPCSSFTYYDADRMGYIKLTMSRVYGGGIRTKRIAIQNAFNPSESYVAEFTYEDGVIGRDPGPYHLNPKRDNEPQRLTMSLMADTRHMGPAMVGYSRVEAVFFNREFEAMGKMAFEFNNYAHKFRPGWEDDRIDTWSPSQGHYHSDYWALVQNTQSDAMYGSLKKRSVFDQQDKLVASEEWFYTLPPGRGMVEETFHIAFKRAELSSYEDGVVRFRMLCSRASFSPWLHKKIEYKEGVYTTTRYSDLHISGRASKVHVDQGMAQHEIQTGFQDSEVSGFGARHTSLNNTNQLSPVASVESFLNGYSQRKVTDHLYNAFPTRLNDDGAFNTQVEIGLYRPYTENIHQNNQIKNVLKVLLRDPAGNVLGWKDVLEREYAVQIDLSGRHLAIANIENANHASFTYSGFEHTASYSVAAGGTRTYADGEVELLTGATVMEEITGVKPHTGDHMLRLISTSQGVRFRTVEDNQPGSGTVIMNGLQTGRRYHVSVWMHEDSPATATINAVLNGTSGSNPINISVSKTISDYSMEAGDWKLVSLEIDVPEDYESSGNTNNDLRIILKNTSGTPAYFDDIKFYPVDASLVTRVNDDRRRRPVWESVNDNLYTRMVYDHAGRIKNIYTEYPDAFAGEKLVESHEYGFKREME